MELPLSVYFCFWVCVCVPLNVILCVNVQPMRNSFSVPLIVLYIYERHRSFVAWRMKG